MHEMNRMTVAGVSGRPINLERMQALLSALRIEQSPQLAAASPVISPVAAPATLGAGHHTASFGHLR
eukprot:5737967-Pleurochrysis_carterae.AAC.1